MKLKELIRQFASFRKSMGADFKSAENFLNTFCRRMGWTLTCARSEPIR